VGGCARGEGWGGWVDYSLNIKDLYGFIFWGSKIANVLAISGPKNFMPNMISLLLKLAQPTQPTSQHIAQR